MANPTTNYSFAMPTNTDLVKDLPADFEIFGQAVDTKIKDLNPETTTGAISYRGATANQKVALPIGTAGQVLAVNSGATAPEWKTITATPASASATVTANETTTSSSYTDLTTSGPTVTLTTGTKALVIVTGEISNNTASGGARMSFEVSGASTISASNEYSVYIRCDTTSGTDEAIRSSTATRLSTLTAGSNTFTAKYLRFNTGTARFLNREISVIDLGS